VAANLSSLAADATRQLDVLGHDGHPLGVDGADVGVLEQPHEIGLAFENSDYGREKLYHRHGSPGGIITMGLSHDNG
jgi:hypothetical protein